MEIAAAKLSKTEFFRNALKAPLKAAQWSTGAYEKTGRYIVLMDWFDEQFKEDGADWVKLDSPNDGTPTWTERQRHLKDIKLGVPVYVIKVKAVDPKAQPKAIEYINRGYVQKVIWDSARLIQNDTYYQLGEHQTIESMMEKP